MTEEQWRTATDPMALLRHLDADRRERKYLLYLVAGCRHIRHLLHHPESVEALDIAERYADGQVSEEDMGLIPGLAEGPTYGHEFVAEYHERYPELRVHLPRLVELGALAESALTGGEWRVNEAVRSRLWAAAELVFLLTSRPSRYDGHLRRVEQVLRMADVGWPNRWLVD